MPRTRPAYRPGVGRTALCALSLALAAAFLGLGCGTRLPSRFVVEHDLGRYEYRRYQKVLDVEFGIEGNPAVGHTASYLLRDPGSRELRFATAFVTVYARAASLTAEVRDQLDALGTYELTVVEVEGEHVFRLRGGQDAWLLWVSGNRLVKLGAPRGADPPEALEAEYLALYPSDLNEHGRARSGAASAGASRAQASRSEDD